MSKYIITNKTHKRETNRFLEGQNKLFQFTFSVFKKVLRCFYLSASPALVEVEMEFYLGH